MFFLFLGLGTATLVRGNVTMVSSTVVTLRHCLLLIITTLQLFLLTLGNAHFPLNIFLGHFSAPNWVLHSICKDVG